LNSRRYFFPRPPIVGRVNNPLSVFFTGCKQIRIA
jgi:hypothetical protein